MVRTEHPQLRYQKPQQFSPELWHKCGIPITGHRPWNSMQIYFSNNSRRILLDEIVWFTPTKWAIFVSLDPTVRIPLCTSSDQWSPWYNPIRHLPTCIVTISGVLTNLPAQDEHTFPTDRPRKWVQIPKHPKYSLASKVSVETLSVRFDILDVRIWYRMCLLENPHLSVWRACEEHFTTARTLPLPSPEYLALIFFIVHHAYMADNLN